MKMNEEQIITEAVKEGIFTGLTTNKPNLMLDPLALEALVSHIMQHVMTKLNTVIKFEPQPIAPMQYIPYPNPSVPWTDPYPAFPSQPTTPGSPYWYTNTDPGTIC